MFRSNPRKSRSRGTQAPTAAQFAQLQKQVARLSSIKPIRVSGPLEVPPWSEDVEYTRKIRLIHDYTGSAYSPGIATFAKAEAASYGLEVSRWRTFRPIKVSVWADQEGDLTVTLGTDGGSLFVNDSGTAGNSRPAVHLSIPPTLQTTYASTDDTNFLTVAKDPDSVKTGQFIIDVTFIMG